MACHTGVQVQADTSPPNCLDLAPSDYYLFQNLKSHLHGTRFLDDDVLKASTEAWFGDQRGDFYFKGIDCFKKVGQ